MKKHTRIFSGALSVVVSASFAFGLCGCNDQPTYTDSDYISDLSESLAVALLGDDIFSWNAFSVTPKRSYGYVRSSDPSWYSYSALTKSDAAEMAELFEDVYNELQTIDITKLTASAAIDYRTLESISYSYADYYGSKYAVDFDLISGSYINSEGGYVADFATSVENFILRNESDVKDLLTVTISTEEAFESYIDYARDRKSAGYPLYDYTVTSMQEYLEDVLDTGDDYYLYSFIDKMLDATDFLTAERKQYYKAEFKSALDDNFMTGVRTLLTGLDSYKGNVTETERSYLAQYGAVGRAYYEWRFSSLTGLRDVDLIDLFDEVYDDQYFYLSYSNDIVSQINELDPTDATYIDFMDYYNGDKGYLDMTEPQEMLDYLKVAAKTIVPDLANTPDIGFKYMDETIADRTNTLAYYIRSPLDETNSRENITLNPTVDNPCELLTTIAHEGYPGHLYAAVNAKSSGAGLLSNVMTCTAFAEGWANYTELAVLDYISSNTDDEALELICDYNYCEIMSGYMDMFLYDLEINYFGYDVSDYVSLGADETRARAIIEMFMEIPAVYVNYGYGLYFMNTLHETASRQLGSAYDEVEFNGKLLSEGFAPTLARAQAITDEYIRSKK